MSTPKKFNPYARRKARRFAVQALYQWQMTATAVNELYAQFMADVNLKKVDNDYFHLLVSEVTANVEGLDELLSPHMERTIAELDLVELAVLRIACFELQQQFDVPYRVVINEALELTKLFGATDSHKYVNGVLDKLAGQLRAAEVAHDRSGQS